MGSIKVEGVTHWSIPVNDLEESEKFYGDLLGLKPLGRLGNGVMSCYNVGDHNILLCEREQAGGKNLRCRAAGPSFLHGEPGVIRTSLQGFSRKKDPHRRAALPGKGLFYGPRALFSRSER